jgi:hypothetical protein
MPKMVTIGWLAAAPHIGEILACIPYSALPYLTFLFFTSPADHPTEPICTHYASKDVD